MNKKMFLGLGTLIMFLTAVSTVQALTIYINAGPELAANNAALSAFQRAANQWGKQFIDPINVTIDANFGTFSSPNIIGSASSVTLVSGFDTIRNAMVADAQPYPDNAIVSKLPTLSQFSYYHLNVSGIAGMAATKANLKALSFPNLDLDFGATDATITFNKDFSFDYDRGDGIAANHMDFETIAAHELGHALGFVSAVDTLDYYYYYGFTVDAFPQPLDLFRFYGSNMPTTEAEFTTKPRLLAPYYQGVFTDLDNEYLFSTGAYIGDGRQASHWKDNNLTGTLIGLMDPTFAYGQIVDVMDADIRAMDLIGYDRVVVPVPGALVLFGSGLLIFRIFRKQS